MPGFVYDRISMRIFFSSTDYQTAARMSLNLNSFVFPDKIVTHLVLIPGNGEGSKVDIKNELIFKETYDVVFWNVLA